MTKNTAQLIGLGGLIFGGYQFADARAKAATISRLTQQLGQAEDGLRGKAARVSALEAERGELLRANDTVNGKLAQASARITTLEATIAELQKKGPAAGGAPPRVVS
jgi:hypothetical protein